MDNCSQLASEVERLAEIEKQVAPLRAALAELAKSVGAPANVQDMCGVVQKPNPWDRRRD